MNKEQAAKILDPETTLEAYAESEYYGGFNAAQHWKDDVNEACQMGAAALREKSERDKSCDCWDDAQREEWLSIGATYCQQCGKRLKL